MNRYPALLRYMLIGVVNTGIHWVVFALIYMSSGIQSISNMMGFLFAATVSFFLNAKWTFKAKITKIRYFKMILFMACLSWFVGFLADRIGFNPLVTLVLFSTTSLILGFLISKFFVFRGRN
jgi:putative flippase GtrA